MRRIRYPDGVSAYVYSFTHIYSPSLLYGTVRILTTAYTVAGMVRGPNHLEYHQMVAG